MQFIFFLDVLKNKTVILKGELMTTFRIPSLLECSISNFYLENNITEPDNLNEKVVGSLFNIEPNFLPTDSFFCKKFSFYTLTIDNRLLPAEQRELFYDGIAHFAHREKYRRTHPIPVPLYYTEKDIDRFTQYLAIPYHMLVEFDLKDKNIIQTLSSTFGVTEELCEKRISDILGKENGVFEGTR
jgi:hypothetical protein